MYVRAHTSTPRHCTAGKETRVREKLGLGCGFGSLGTLVKERKEKEEGKGEEEEDEEEKRLPRDWLGEPASRTSKNREQER